METRVARDRCVIGDAHDGMVYPHIGRPVNQFYECTSTLGYQRVQIESLGLMWGFVKSLSRIVTVRQNMVAHTKLNRPCDRVLRPTMRRSRSALVVQPNRLVKKDGV